MGKIDGLVCPARGIKQVKEIIDRLSAVIGERPAYIMWSLNDGNFSLDDNGEIVTTNFLGEKITRDENESEEEFIKRRYEEMMLIDEAAMESALYHASKSNLTRSERKKLQKKMTQEELDEYHKELDEKTKFIRYGNILRTAIDNTGSVNVGKESRRIQHVSPKVLQSMIEIAKQQKKPYRTVLQSGKKVLAAVIDGNVYINIGAVNPFVQMYEYTQLFAWRLYNSAEKKDIELWDSICDFITGKRQLLSSEVQRLSKAKVSAMKTLGLSKSPKKGDDSYNLFIAETLAILSGQESGKNKNLVMSAADDVFTEDNTASNFTKYKAVIHKVADALKTFWNRILEFFGLDKKRFSTVHELASLSLYDLMSRSWKTLSSTASRSDMVAKSLTKSEIEDRTAEVKEKLNDNKSSFLAEHAKVKTNEKIKLGRKYQNFDFRNKLEIKYYDDNRLTVEEKVALERKFKEGIVQCVLDAANKWSYGYLQFFKDDTLTKEQLEQIEEAVEENNFSPYSKIIEIIGLGKLTKYSKRYVLDALADYKKEDKDNYKAIQTNISSFVNDYAELIMARIDDMFMDFFGLSVSLKFGKDGKNEIKKLDDDDNTDSNADDESRGTVTQYLQTEQLHRSFKKSIDGTLKMLLSTIQGYKANDTDIFGSAIGMQNEIMNLLISNFNTCTSEEELRNALMSSNFPLLRDGIINLMDDIKGFGTKLVSSIQMAVNTYRQYSSADGEIIAHDHQTKNGKFMDCSNFSALIGTKKKHSKSLFYPEKQKDGQDIFVYNENYGNKLLVDIQDIEFKIKRMFQEGFSVLDENDEKIHYDGIPANGSIIDKTIGSEIFFYPVMDSHKEEFLLIVDEWKTLIEEFYKKAFNFDFPVDLLDSIALGPLMTISDRLLKSPVQGEYNAFNMLEFIRVTEELFNKFNERLRKQQIQSNSGLLSFIEQQLSVINKKVGNHMPTQHKTSIYAGGGKLYSTFSPSNYITRTNQELNKLRPNSAEKPIQSRYLHSIYHRYLLLNEQSCDFSTLLMPTRVRSIECCTTTTMNDIKYEQFNLLQYLAYSISNYDKGSTKSKFIQPVLADKGTHYSDNWVKVHNIKMTTTGYSSEELLDNFYAYFAQEIERMRTLYRDRNISPVKIKNLHPDEIKTGQIPFGDGFRFAMFPTYNILIQNAAGLVNDNALPKELNGMASELKSYILGETHVLSNNFANKFKDTYQEYLNNEAANLRYTVLANIDAAIKVTNNPVLNTVKRMFDDEQLMYEWFWNNSNALMTQYEVLMGDLVLYKNTDMVSKRASETCSPGLKPDTTPTTLYKQGLTEDGKSKWNDSKKRSITFKDERRDVLSTDLSNMIDKSKEERIKEIDSFSDLTTEEKAVLKQQVEEDTKRYKEHFRSTDTTDGQGIISPDYVGRFLHGLGRDMEYMKAYEELVAIIDKYDPNLKGEEYKTMKAELRKEAVKFNKKYSNLIVEVFKQFTYSQINIKSAEKDAYWLSSRQTKNSEYPAIDILGMLDSKDETLLRLVKMMREQGIDAILFESNVKNGMTGYATDKMISDYTSDIQLIEDVTNNIKNDYDNVVTEEDMKFTSLQQETTSHFENHRIVLGNQIIKLCTRGVKDNLRYDVGSKDHSLYFTGRALKKKFQELLARKIVLSMDEGLFGTIGSNITKTDAERLEKAKKKNKNITLEEIEMQVRYNISEMLKDKISANRNYDNDLIKAVSMVDGDFNVNLNDPLIFDQLMKIVVSETKKVCQRIEIDGALLVQVTDAVNVTNKVKGDKNLKVVFKYHDDKPIAISHFEARIPPYNKKLYKYADKDGVIDIEKIKKEAPELLECVAYRIPTEGYCSMIPIKIVGFTNKITGGIIQLPPVVTAYMGIDFDIDKLNVICPSIEEKDIKDEEGEKVGTKLSCPIADFNDIQHANTKECNNLILRFIRNILTHPQTAMQQVVPSNYFHIKKKSDVYTLLKAKLNSQKTGQKKKNVKTARELYDEYNNMDYGKLNILQKSSHKEFDMTNIHDQLRIHQRNYAGKRILEIAASTLTTHTMARDWNLSLNGCISKPFTLFGITIKKGTYYDVYKTHDKSMDVISILQEFLTAAPDTVKDPVFENLNINMQTIGPALVLARLGFTIDEILLFLNQPAILKYAELGGYDMSEYNENTLKITENYLKALVSEDVDKVKFKHKSDDDISSDLLMQNLCMSLDNLSNDKQALNDQHAILKVFETLLKIGKAGSIIREIGNQNNQNSKQFKDIYEMMKSSIILDKKLQVLKEGQGDFSANLYNVLKEPGSTEYNQFLATAYNTRKKLVNAYLNKFYPVFKHFVEIENNKKETFGDTLKGNKTKNIKREWEKFITYLFFNMDHTDEEGNHIKGFLSSDEDVVRYYQTIFPVYAIGHVKQLITEHGYGDNSFLKAIYADFSGGAKLMIRSSDVTGIEKSQMEKDWDMLLHDKDDSVVDFATELFIYLLYKDGFSYKMDSFGKVITTDLKMKCGQYNAFLEQINTLSTEEIAGYISKFEALPESSNYNYHNLYDRNISGAIMDENSQLSFAERQIEIDTGIDVSVLNIDVNGFMLEEAKEKYNTIC